MPTNAVAKLTVVFVAAAATLLFFTRCTCAQLLPSWLSPATESANAPTEIWGVSALEISSNSVTITKTTTGAHSGLTLLIDDRVVTEATLSIGDEFLMADGRHVSRFYRLICIEQDLAIFRVKEQLNLISFGDKNRETTQTLRFTSYSQE